MTNPKMRIAILHGTKSTPESNWFPYAASKLREGGHEVIVPKLPTPQSQSLTTWFECFNNTFGELSADTILVGHSLGALFSLRLLEQASCQIAATFLVAGLTAQIGIKEYDDLNASFIAPPLQWEKLRKASRIFTCILGSNDPYVPREQPLKMSEMLHCLPIIIQNGGHLNSESGYVEFPELILEFGRVFK